MVASLSIYCSGCFCHRNSTYLPTELGQLIFRPLLLSFRFLLFLFQLQLSQVNTLLCSAPSSSLLRQCLQILCSLEQLASCIACAVSNTALLTCPPSLAN